MTGPDQLRALERQLQLAHQSRRASEHLLDGIRRAMCDAGFMRDDDPYGHADLADVIRQAGEAATAEEMPPALPSARTLIHNVLGYVSGCVYAMDRDYVEELTDRLWDLYCGPAEEAKPEAARPCDIDHDCPGQVRQPPHCGCEAWDHGERHPEHQWRSSTGQRVRCNGEPPSTPGYGDRVRVAYEATWGDAGQIGGLRRVSFDLSQSVRCVNSLPDGATVEVIGRAGGTE